MAVPGREHINLILLFFFCFGLEHINFTSAFISLLFLFSFHNKNVCFELKINKTNSSISSSMKKKIAFYFHFICN